MFSCEICEIFKDNYFEEHLRTTFFHKFITYNEYCKYVLHVEHGQYFTRVFNEKHGENGDELLMHHVKHMKCVARVLHSEHGEFIKPL